MLFPDLWRVVGKKKKKKVPEPEKKQRGVQGDDERMRSEHRERGKSWI